MHADEVLEIAVAALEEIKAEFKDQHLFIRFTGEEHGKYSVIGRSGKIP